jgi:hypothetical protein
MKASSARRSNARIINGGEDDHHPIKTVHLEIDQQENQYHLGSND